MKMLIKYKIGMLFLVFTGVFLLKIALLPIALGIINMQKNEWRQFQIINEISKSFAMLDSLTMIKLKLEKEVKQAKISTGANERQSIIFKLISDNAIYAALRVDNIFALPEENKNSHVEQTFEIKVKGAYHEIGKFVNLVENSNYLIKVNKVYLVSSGSSQDDILGNLQITFYSLL